jgi:hypothetical protein
VPDVPAPLAWLTDRLSRLIATATDSLEAQYPDGVDAWQQEVSRQLARCAWDIVQLAGDGNYDCTWQISDVEHCQICRQRALDWAPLKVREGVVQI